MKVEENRVEFLERCLTAEQAREDWETCPEWWVALSLERLKSSDSRRRRLPLRFKKTSDGKIQYLLWYLKKKDQLHLVPEEFREWADANL